MSGVPWVSLQVVPSGDHSAALSHPRHRPTELPHTCRGEADPDHPYISSFHPPLPPIPLSFSLSHSITLSFSFSLSHSTTLSFSLSVSAFHSLCHSLILSHCLTCSFFLVSFTHSLSHALSFTLSLCFSCFVSISFPPLSLPFWLSVSLLPPSHFPLPPSAICSSCSQSPLLICLHSL